MKLSDIMNNQKIIQRVLEKKQVLDSKRPLPKAVLRNLKESLSVEWTYNSNAIEGNSLSLRETQLVLREGMTIKGKSLREHFEAKNHEKAIEYLGEIVQLKYRLSEKDIFHIHSLVLNGIEEEFAGRYRNGQVRIVGANFIPPNYLKIDELMKELVAAINKNPEKTDLITLAAKTHHKFVCIHPFFDGNGRSARLIMNLLLMKYGFPPTEIYEGMVIGEANNGNDMVVNPLKNKKLTNVRASGTDEALNLTPIVPMTLEKAIEYIGPDEYVEITPKKVRLRKKYLNEIERKRNTPKKA